MMMHMRTSRDIIVIYEFRELTIGQHTYKSRIIRVDTRYFWEVLCDGTRVLLIDLGEALIISAEVVCKVIGIKFSQVIQWRYIETICEFIGDLLGMTKVILKERRTIFNSGPIHIFGRIYRFRVVLSNGDYVFELLENGSKVLSVKLEDILAPGAEYLCRVVSTIFWRLPYSIVDILCDFIADLIRLLV